jgi:hypothetical protein
MSDQAITPALTPEEWAEALERGGLSKDGTYYLPERAPNGLTVGITSEIGTFFHQQEIPTLIALANHALPDTDPRKLTREDLHAVMDASNGQESEFNEGDDRLYRLEAKLAALLPPDGT